MKALLISVCLIYFYECYYPLPDWDRLQFEKYYKETSYLCKAGVPQEILIYHEIDSEVSTINLIDKYGCRNKPWNTWVKALQLNEEQTKRVLKFKKWINEKH